MLQRVHCILLLAALALLASPATAAAVAVDAPAAEAALSESPKDSLVRRFTSPFAQLRERKTSRVGLAGAKKRTLSDELLSLLSGELAFPSILPRPLSSFGLLKLGGPTPPLLLSEFPPSFSDPNRGDFPISISDRNETCSVESGPHVQSC